MEDLQGDPTVVYQDSEGTGAGFFPGHTGQGIALILLDGGGLGDLLQVIPEYAPAKPAGDGGEPAYCHIQGGLQYRNIHLLCEGHGHPEHTAPVLPPGSGIDLGSVVQPHPAKLALAGMVLIQELVQSGHVFLILFQPVEQIHMPPLRTNHQPNGAAGVLKLLSHKLRIAEEDLVTTCKDQGGGKAGQVTKEGGNEGVFGIAAVGIPVKLDLAHPQRRVYLPVILIGGAGGGQIRPGGDGNDGAGERKLQLLQLQTQAEA